MTCVVSILFGLPVAARAGAPLPVESRHASARVAVHLVQDEEGSGDENEVPPQDVDKYIKVYQAMQHNRNLTVEQAAAAQGLSVTAFRSLEDRIERNDALREHVRDALKPQASPSPSRK
jgi:hypothetical protein